MQIDSPVSGGVAGAVKGTLAVMVSGPQADIDAVKDALSVFGTVFVIGHKAGMAQTMKLANNFLSATAMAATSEAVVMGVKAGLDPAIMVDVINHGSGRNTATTDKFPKAIIPRTFNLGFATALMLKDVRLCVAEARALGVPDEVMSAVLGVWETANTEIGGDADFTTVIQPIEKRAGVTVGGRNHERRHSRGLCRPLRRARAQAQRELHLRRSARRDDGDCLLRLGDQGPHGIFVFDTGFDQAAAKERGRKIIHPVGEGLQALGVEPDKVDHVIATHMHWDHAGNYDLFPNARYHVQDTEMAYCTGRCMCHQTLRIPFSEDDVHAMVRKVYAYRVEFHDGSRGAGARHHRAQDRRPFEGAAMRAGEDAARLCRARLRLLPPLFAHRRGPRVPDHLQRRRHARGLQDAAEARLVAPAHGAGARSGGAQALSGGERRIWRTGSRGWTWSRKVSSLSPLAGRGWRALSSEARAG